jgi:hypothetical protein
MAHKAILRKNAVKRVKRANLNFSDFSREVTAKARTVSQVFLFFSDGF